MPADKPNIVFILVDNVWWGDFKAIAEYERSMKQYPNIKVGEDFKGYKQ